MLQSESLGYYHSGRSGPVDFQILLLNEMFLHFQELANPYVYKYLTFIPELPTSTKIDRFSQCRKWRELLDPDMRVQMVSINRYHFYLFEPVQLHSKELVIPQFFYQQESSLYAKCCLATVVWPPGQQQPRIEFPGVQSFNSELLKSVPCSSFWRVWNDIHVNGVCMKDISGEYMYGKCSKFLL